MADTHLDTGSTVLLPKPLLDELLSRLRASGYQTVGPHVRENALMYEPIQSIADLPQGYTSEQDAGRYRLSAGGHTRYFDVTPGPHTWKQFLFPPRETFFKLRKNAAWAEQPDSTAPARYALIGVRACEIAAIGIQDRVFLREDFYDPLYRERRQNLFILSVNCLHPGGTCFCASMGTGPRVAGGFDLNLTELEDEFLLEIGSELGCRLLAGMTLQPASAFKLQAAQKSLEHAVHEMGRSLDIHDLPDLLLNSLEHPRWKTVAKRCLSCASCTQVCPTCFCWDVVEHPNLGGNLTSRERVWDSCFNPGYSALAGGGNTRPTVRSRYRQWLTHKLGSWKQQFDVLGCVGCGRCITWCPVGIDLTEEIPALREEVRS
jgi:sulfhydrogenase subunit beta (sulfur reductase)